jgi:hypothetical protein
MRKKSDAVDLVPPFLPHLSRRTWHLDVQNYFTFTAGMSCFVYSLFARAIVEQHSLHEGWLLISA